MEKHHKVRVAEEAIVAAVNFSHRYIPARQLPDKAVSLLDTACARVAISQTAKPAVVEDCEVEIASLEAERAALQRESDLSDAQTTKIAAIDEKLVKAREKAAGLDEHWGKEKALVKEILDLRAKLAEAEGEPDVDRAALREKAETLSALPPETRMIYPHVDEQAVAAVVSDWTGIPVGRMMADEVETVLNLADILNRRIVGQSHGLQMIARRIETNRARLDNPSKPVGVFLLCGPSGVGKTETALALAESLYGGEQNIITINMSEFQEAHTVATLKGAPPGYIGYGEGGRLTEAVRRRPYSVVLLDEIEKAHPDVHGFPQYADPADLQRRHRNDHGRRQAAEAAGRVDACRCAETSVAGGVPARAAWPRGDDPLLSAQRRHARWHRAAATQARRRPHRRTSQGDVRGGRQFRRVDCFDVQRSRLRWSRDRQRHHQHDPAGAIARDSQASACA
jgi:ATP-dependent Clp protease ATP-binding subunit ClpA